ncbi:MAG: RdgB/HAM1 family non-canonical purine NTP pyrophosphatase [Betaproteobacteria bacterium]|nr:RdgB/HAM1 family non-canonical purine NTP pyrophosphatase [Betaproteobacteria bacterium]
MTRLERIVIAGSNPGKLREIRELLAPLSIQIVSQGELGIADPAEPHHTFLENALVKARHASQVAGLPALADDSGICVAALGGEPDVNSAYYAGREGTREERDARNNAKLLAALAPHANKIAHYACVMVLVRYPGDPQPLIAQANWKGEITDRPRGANGFGYDPLFLLPDLGRTAAELDGAEKNRISHRGLALQRLVAQLREDC